MASNSGKSDPDLSPDASWTVINGSETPPKTNSVGNLDEIDVEKGENVTKEVLEEKPKPVSRKCSIIFLKTKKKKLKSGFSFKKLSLDKSTIVSMVAFLLTVTGLSLLNSLAPTPENDNLQQQIPELYHSQNNFNSTINNEALLLAPDLNFNDIEICDADNDDPFNYSFTPKELEAKIIGPFKERKLEDIYQKVKKSVEEPKNNKSLLKMAEMLIKNTTVQVLVTTLVQDFCLIKLLTEFYKLTKKEPSKLRKKVLKRPKPALSNTDAPGNNPDSKININENGKSECERRFQELEHKWEEETQNRRQKVKEIKENYQKQISEIKEQEKDSASRQQKIYLTSEKFIQKLKADREAYIQKLKNIREKKQAFLKTICQNYKTSKVMGSRDVSVGSFSELLPSDYDFFKKLNEIKQKEGSSRKLETTKNETFSYTPSTSNNNEENISNEITNKSNKKPKNNYYEWKKKMLKRKALLLKKKQFKKQSREVQGLATNILKSLSEAASKSSTNNQILGPTPNASSTNLSLLYDVAFEDQGKQIKYQDSIKWNKKYGGFKWTIPSDFMKKEPLRKNKQKMIFKGVL